MISEYVLRGLHKLFPDSQIDFEFYDERLIVEIGSAKSLFNHYVYNAKTHDLKISGIANADKLQRLITLLSLIDNVNLEEVSKDE